MTIKAVLFDMDGVLIDARQWHYDTLNQVLKLFAAEIPMEEHLLHYDGLPTRKKLERLSAQKGFPRALHALINTLKQRYTMETVRTQCHPVLTQVYALSQLKSLGYRLAVCSNSIRQTVELMMEKSGLAPYLDVMLSNEDIPRPKPAPDIYLEAMRRFDLLPQECLVVEDNENGIAAARASGAHLLVVKEVCETNLDNILCRIEEIEAQEKVKEYA